MTKIVYLHVGFHKTASSSIQLQLFHAKEYLEECNYYYPKNWRFNHNFLFGVFCENPNNFYENVFKKKSPSQIKIDNERYKQSFVDEMGATNVSNIIISSEDLSVLGYEGVQKLKTYLNETIEDCIIKVVICVRETLSFITSDVQQAIKTGFNFDLNNYKDLYSSRIDKYITLFGRDNIILYKFEDAIADKTGPIGFFLKQLGLSDVEVERVGQNKINESLSGGAVDLIRYINSHVPISKGSQLSEGRNFGDTKSLEAIIGGKFELTFDEKSQIANNSQKDINWLKNNFDISYEEVKAELTVAENKIEEGFREHFTSNFHKLSPLLAKLCYLYFLDKSIEMLDEGSIDNLLAVIKNINIRHKEIVISFRFDGMFRKLKEGFPSGAADALREIAIFYEEKKDIKNALRFMLEAQYLRANGPMINSKVEYYQKFLNGV